MSENNASSKHFYISFALVSRNGQITTTSLVDTEITWIMSITRQLTVKLCDAFHITLLIAAKIPFRLNVTTNTLTEVVLSLGRFWLD